ncbi:MAG: bifunctional nuclease family protein [Chitinivibrionia bacterium]|nr:bifunctional nuclease family protein [Chitinivibrionia bacterium]
MPENDSSFIRVEIGGIVKDTKDNPVVLLKAVEREEVLPIWIGPAEALSIEMKLEGKKFERPLTHDLLKTALETFGAVVVKVVVSELKNNTFYAKIYLQRDNEIFVFDARPSDSIALALRTKRKYLRDLDPGDF